MMIRSLNRWTRSLMLCWWWWWCDCNFTHASKCWRDSVQEKTGSAVNMNVTRCVLMDHADSQGEKRRPCFKRGWEREKTDQRRKSTSLPPLLCKACVRVTDDTGQDHLSQAACASATCTTGIELHEERQRHFTCLICQVTKAKRQQWCYLFKVMSSVAFTAPSSWFSLQRPVKPFLLIV